MRLFGVMVFKRIGRIPLENGERKLVCLCRTEIISQLIKLDDGPSEMVTILLEK